MKQPTKHHLVDFAARYAGTRFQTLNVSSALWRAEALVLDAEEMLELKRRPKTRISRLEAGFLPTKSFLISRSASSPVSNGTLDHA